MVVQQGEIFWADFDEPRGSEPGFIRPCVILQNNAFNQTDIRTVVVCLLTSNLRRATAPGNVQLRKGEANLPKSSVVNITQIYTLDRMALLEKIGTLSNKRMREIIAGVQLLIEPFE